MATDVTVDDALKKMLAKCKPGQSKEMNVTVSMAEDGKVTLKPSAESEETYEAEPPPKPKKKASRPKPVMDAISAMY